MKTYSCTKDEADCKCVGYVKGECLSFENCQYKKEDSGTYEYFVSYSHQDGFGCSLVNYYKTIRSMDDLLEIRKEIAVATKFEDIVILNYQPVNG